MLLSGVRESDRCVNSRDRTNLVSVGGDAMALQVSGNNPGTIGRMFARQNVQDLYGRQKSVVETADVKSPDQVDRVVLSSQAPKPLSASLVEDAMGTGKKLSGKGRLTADEEDALREDRVFAAVAMLAALGTEAETRLPGWPGGLPAPTREEMEAAYRRLSQRLNKVDEASNPETASRARVEIVEKNRKTDFGELANRSISLVASAGSKY